MLFSLNICLCLQTATPTLTHIIMYHLQYYPLAFTTQEKCWTRTLILKKGPEKEKSLTSSQPETIQTARCRDSINRVCKQLQEPAFYLACAFYLEEKWEKLPSQPRAHDYWFSKEIILPAAVFLKSPFLNTLLSLNGWKRPRLEAFISKPLQDKSTQKTWRKSLIRGPTQLCWDCGSVKSCSFFPHELMWGSKGLSILMCMHFFENIIAFYSWILHECICAW